MKCKLCKNKFDCEFKGGYSDFKDKEGTYLRECICECKCDDMLSANANIDNHPEIYLGSEVEIKPGECNDGTAKALAKKYKYDKKTVGLNLDAYNRLMWLKAKISYKGKIRIKNISDVINYICDHMEIK